ncbi:MAG: hypothetical protein KC912_09805 [Proteobacteria bacterium]|nr:hypothetical protein [Pseudomonadota bacterium]
MRSVLDTFLVARFELMRAMRTWRAVALATLYVIALSGATYIYVRILWFIEAGLAETLGVPANDKPGAMMNELMDNGDLTRMLQEMSGSPEAVEYLLTWPLLSIWGLWIGILLLPFLATSAAAECISIDMSTRALRFEALRTGRAELVLGRFFGQVALTGIAASFGLVGAWVVGMTQMVGNDPIVLAYGLAAMGLRAWLFGLPFIGLGVAWSQWTASPNWARVLSVSFTAGSWILFGLATEFRDSSWGWLSDLVLQVLPQGWLNGLWHPTDWIISGGVYIALSLLAVGLGFIRFSRRDL